MFATVMSSTFITHGNRVWITSRETRPNRAFASGLSQATHATNADGFHMYPFPSRPRRFRKEKLPFFLPEGYDSPWMSFSLPCSFGSRNYYPLAKLVNYLSRNYLRAREMCIHMKELETHSVTLPNTGGRYYNWYRKQGCTLNQV